MDNFTVCAKLRLKTLVGQTCTPHPWTRSVPCVRPWRPGSPLTPATWSSCTARSEERLYCCVAAVCIVCIVCSVQICPVALHSSLFYLSSSFSLTGKQGEDGGHRGGLHALQQDLRRVCDDCVRGRLCAHAYCQSCWCRTCVHLYREFLMLCLCLCRVDQALTTLAMRKFCEDKVSSSLQPSQNRQENRFFFNVTPLLCHAIFPTFLLHLVCCS